MANFDVYLFESEFQPSDVVLRPSEPGVTEFLETIQDATSLSDQIAVLLVGDRTQEDSLGLTDSISVLSLSTREQTDVLGVADQAFGVGVALKSQEDVLGLQDQVVVAAVATPAFLERIALLDTIVVSLGLLLDDSLTYGDTSEQVSFSVAGQSDSIGLADGVAAIADGDRIVFDQSSLSDTASPNSTYQRAKNEAIALSDLAVLTAAIAETDAAGLADHIEVVVSYRPEATDLLGFRDWGYADAPSDSDGSYVYDEVVASVVRAVEAQDRLELTDSIVLGHVAAISNQVGLADSVEIEGTAIVAVVQTISVSQVTQAIEVVGSSQVLEPTEVDQGISGVQLAAGIATLELSQVLEPRLLRAEVPLAEVRQIVEVVGVAQVIEVSAIAVTFQAAAIASDTEVSESMQTTQHVEALRRQL